MQVIGPLLPYLLQSETLNVCCAHFIDSSVQQLYRWDRPDETHLCWWHNLKNEEAARNWLGYSERKITLDWHLAVASGYFSAAYSWYLECIEDLYVSDRKNHEFAHCSVLNCGQNHGLALELSISLESRDKQEHDDLSELPVGVTKQSETVSLADISTGIPQILAGSTSGEWLPPFHNGDSWLLLRVDRIERPSLSELKPVLLRQSMRKWRNQKIKDLTESWLRQITEIGNGN